MGERWMKETEEKKSGLDWCGSMKGVNRGIDTQMGLMIEKGN